MNKDFSCLIHGLAEKKAGEIVSVSLGVTSEVGPTPDSGSQSVTVKLSVATFIIKLEMMWSFYKVEKRQVCLNQAP